MAVDVTGCLRGFSNKLRQMQPGDAVTVECADRRAMQTTLAGCVASYKRGGGRGWQRYSIKQVAAGVMVTRLPDAI